MRHLEREPIRNVVAASLASRPHSEKRKVTPRYYLTFPPVVTLLFSVRNVTAGKFVVPRLIKNRPSIEVSLGAMREVTVHAGGVMREKTMRVKTTRVDRGDSHRDNARRDNARRDEG